MKTVTLVLASFRKGDILFLVDLKDVNFQIPIHPLLHPQEDDLSFCGTLYQPFDSTLRCHQSLHIGFNLVSPVGSLSYFIIWTAG